MNKKNVILPLGFHTYSSNSQKNILMKKKFKNNFLMNDV